MTDTQRTYEIEQYVKTYCDTSNANTRLIASLRRKGVEEVDRGWRSNGKGQSYGY